VAWGKILRHDPDRPSVAAACECGAEAV